MEKDFKKLDNLLKEFAEKRTVPGCACAVMQGDDIVYEGYYGYADIASGKPVTRDSMFLACWLRKASSCIPIP